MKNIPNNLDKSENILAIGITEDLQRIAPDKFFIVGEQIIKNGNVGNLDIRYNHKEGILACFKNQWEKIEIFLKANNPTLLGKVKNNLSIVDLGELRKGKNTVLYGKTLSEKINLRLISGGSMNLLTSKQGNKHLLLTTRDGGNVDVAQLTGVAGRCETPEIDNESLKEFVEEGSFLGYVNGELNVIIPSVLGGKEDIKKYVERFFAGLKRNAIDNAKSTVGFLSEKYKPDNEVLTKMFNKNFNDKIGDLEYSNLGEKIEEALSKGRILFYKIKEDKSKYNSKIQINGKRFEGFVYNDEENNTTEYRKVYDIDLNEVTGMRGERINGVSYIGRLARPSSMFLESENQSPRTINLSKTPPSNIYNRLVPATKALVFQVISKNK